MKSNGEEAARRQQKYDSSELSMGAPMEEGAEEDVEGPDDERNLASAHTKDFDYVRSYVPLPNPPGGL